MFKKILIINTFGIGDVLFTTPLIHHIKLYHPAVSIGYLLNRRTTDLLENNPDVDKIFVYERDEFYSIYKSSKVEFLKRASSTLASIKEQKYDAVVDLSLNTGTGFLMKWAGIPVRMGFDYKNRGVFLTKKIPLKGYEDKHVVEYYLSLFPELVGRVVDHQLRIYCDAQDQQWAEDFLTEHALGQKIMVGIFPGGGASWGKDSIYKRWPVKRYAALADKIIEKFSARVILFGNEQEVELCERMRRLMKGNAFQACGKATLRQSAALLKRCSLAVLNDGGPLHIAVAVGTKTVSLFGPVDERVYGPYPSDGHFVVKSKIPCRPCYRRFRKADCHHISCLSQIAVDDVFTEVEKAIKDTKTNSHNVTGSQRHKVTM